MNDVTLIAILLAFFALAIGLVRVLGRMIEGDGDPEEFPTSRRTPAGRKTSRAGSCDDLGAARRSPGGPGRPRPAITGRPTACSSPRSRAGRSSRRSSSSTRG